MLDSFAMYPPLWSQCDLWSHASHFWNVPPKVATGHMLNENPRFFHNFVCNVSTMGLSHSLRLLSKSILKCDHNVSCHYFMGSLRVCGEIGSHWGFIVITLKEPPGDIVITLQDTFWKKSQWVAQTHGRHIANKIVKEPGVFIQHVPSGYFGGDISKVTSMYPLGNVWKNCLKNLNVTSMCPPGKFPLAPSVKKTQLNQAEVEEDVEYWHICEKFWSTSPVSGGWKPFKRLTRGRLRISGLFLIVSGLVFNKNNS